MSSPCVAASCSRPGWDRAPARARSSRARAQSSAPGLARAAVVVGDERVPGEESAPVRGLQAEVERLCGGLARPAREHDHHAARLADRRELLDVERHLTGAGSRSRAGRSSVAQTRPLSPHERKRRCAAAAGAPTSTASTAPRGMRRFIGSQGSGGFAQPPREYTRTSGTARFRLSSWTGRPCIRSPRELAENERLVAFADDLLGATRARLRAGAAARSSPRSTCALEPRARLRCSPEDADARDAAEAAAWYLGDEQVALLPSRGVRWDSGLEPPPHLVGERARALDVLAAGGLVCASAAALAELMPPPGRAPRAARPRRRRRSRASTVSPSSSRSPGYERVERVEERGQFAVRGGIVDVFPTTGREPLRIELLRRRDRGDPRLLAVHPARAPPGRARDRLPGGRAPARSRRADAPGRRRGAPSPRRPRAARSTAPPTSSSSRRRSRRVWEEEQLDPVPISTARRMLDPFPRGQPHAFEAQRPAVAARGLAEAENELASFVRAGPARRRRLPAPRRRAPHREPAAHARGRAGSRRAESSPTSEGLFFTVSPARRGFVWRDLGLVLLPDTQIFRKRAPRGDARLGRALQSFADLRTGDYVVHEDHGVGKLLGFETKEVAGVTRDYLFLAFRGEDRLYVPHEQIGKVSRYIGADAKAPALSKLGGKAWLLLKSRARESVQELAGELIALYARRQTTPGVAYDLSSDWLERLEAEFPYRETEDQQRAIEAVKEDLEAPSADGPARLRRRRLRQDRGRGPRRLRGRAERQADADARPDDGARAAALEHVPRALPRLPRAGRDGLALPQAGRDEGGARRTSPRARSTS